MRIGAYEVEAEIGRGGAGAVFRARADDGRAVALKLLLRLDEKRLARFDRERRLLASLGAADGFVPLIDWGDSERGPFLVMPLLEGGTLRERLIRGKLAVPETVALGEKLASALARAHEKGIVHRDLKPENVLFDGERRPFVADLGLAKHFDLAALGASKSVSLSRVGELRGTPGYLAPEQMRDSKAAGPSADIFALGAILYECLCGGPAFQADSTVELLAKIDSLEPESLATVRPDAPRWLVHVVERCLAKTPEARYRDAGELGRALAARATPAAKRSARRVAALLGALVVVVGLGVGVGAWALSTPTKAVPWSSLIEPGRGVGALAIAESTDHDARRELGEAARVGTDTTVLQPGPWVGALIHDGRVAEIAIGSRSFRTRGGVGVGSSVEQVTAEFGGERSGATNGIVAYFERGIAFDFAGQAKSGVERVLVFAPQRVPAELAASSRVLVLGKGIDRIVLGQSRLPDVRAAFGSDGLLVEERGIARFTYLRDAHGAWLPDRPANALRPTVFTLREGIVVDASVTGVETSELRTESGLALGVGREAVQKQLGAEDGWTVHSWGSTWFYDVLGVAVLSDLSSGKVSAITIFPAARPEALVAAPGSGVRGIVAGKSTLADVLRVVGEGARIVREEEGNVRVECGTGIDWLDRRRPERVDLDLDLVKRVVLGPASGGLATRAGIRIGSKRAAVESAYGKPFGTFQDNNPGGTPGETLYWPADGLDVHVDDRAGEVDSIWLSTAVKVPGR